MKGLTSLLTTVSLLCLAWTSGAQPMAIQIGAQRYRFVGPADRLVPDSIRALDATLTEETENIDHVLHTGLPPATVIVAGDAASFREMTGQSWQVAAVYRPGDDLLIFQNPQGLRTGGILRATVRHELCHRAAAMLNGTGGSHENWVEESVCEAYARSERTDCAPLRTAIHNQVVQIEDYEALTRLIRSAVHSERIQERRTGFCVAIDWGQHLITRNGLRTSLVLSAHPDSPQLAGAFAGFQERWSDRQD